MSFTLKRRILNGIAIVLILAILIFRDFFSKTVLGITVLLLWLTVLCVLNLLWWRCPHCNAYLWKLSPFATHCPFCGSKFE